MFKNKVRGAVGAIEIVLIIVVLAVAGLVVWRLMSADNEDATEEVGAEEMADGTTTETVSTETTNTSISESWVRYYDEEFQFSIAYPESEFDIVQGNSIKYPDTSMDPPGIVLEGTGDDDWYCNLTIEPVLGPGLFEGIANEGLRRKLYANGLEAIAQNSQEINADSINSNFPDREVSDLVQGTRGTLNTYEFTVTDELKTDIGLDEGSGQLIGGKSLVIFFQIDDYIFRAVVLDQQLYIDIFNTLQSD